MAPLKRLDRWLSNRAMQTARCSLYGAAVARLVRQRHPVVIVAWSELPRDGAGPLLRASIARKGRALTRYEEGHPQRRLGARRVHPAFLRQLQARLPAACCPIIITDAGFHTPWFRAVESLPGYWLGRVRARTQIRAPQAHAPWRAVRDYFAGAAARAESLGHGMLTASNPVHCHIVCVKRPPKDGRNGVVIAAGHRAARLVPWGAGNANPGYWRAPPNSPIARRP